MEKEVTALFIGHGDAPYSLKNKIKNEIVELIKTKNASIFLNGGMGNFDIMCAECVKELQQDFPHIKSIIVLPYLNFSGYNINLFDENIYPDLETIPPRAAIVKRNEWMVKHSGFALCYVTKSVGGAVKTFKLAEKNSLFMVNLL